MVKLEVVSFLAAPATLVHIRATRTVALVNGPPHRRRDVPNFPGFIWRRDNFADAFLRLRVFLHFVDFSIGRGSR
jgi:hypothetical protein